MVQALLLAALTLAGVVQVWHLILLSLFLGVVNTFDMTARQAFLTEMVSGREDLGNAVALSSSMVDGARLVGPSLAGLLLAARAGLKQAFVVNGLLLLAGAAVFACHLPRLRKLVRPIYVRLGILPEIAAGIENATALSMTVKE